MNHELQPGVAAERARCPGVLIADDEPEILTVLNLGLQREGFSVWLATDGRAALHLYREHGATIDVVLLDVRMPHLDGPRTLAELQKLKPELPCCFMSGGIGCYSTDELYKQGARAILMKPFRLLEVAQVLRGVVEQPCPASARPLIVGGLTAGLRQEECPVGAAARSDPGRMSIMRRRKHPISMNPLYRPRRWR